MCHPLFWNEEVETIELVSIIKILEKAFIEYIFSTTWCNWLRIVHINKKMTYVIVTLMTSYIMRHFTHKPIFLKYYLKRPYWILDLKWPTNEQMNLLYHYFQPNHEIGLIWSSLFFFQYKPYKNIILEIIMVSNLKEIFNLKNNKSWFNPVSTKIMYLGLHNLWLIIYHS